MFVGTVLETNDNQDGFIKPGLWYRVRVDERFRGLSANVGEVIVDPDSGNSCQAEFKVGKRYLFSAYGPRIGDQQFTAMSIPAGVSAKRDERPKGLVLRIGECSGTRPEEYAQEDIQFIREYMHNPQPARIAAYVYSNAEWDLSPWAVKRVPPLAGVTLKVLGPGGERRCVTDEKGRCEFRNVAPGKYGIYASLAGYLPTPPEYGVEVPAYGCAIASLGMFTNGRLSGRVLRHDGRAAVDVPVEVLFANHEYSTAYIHDSEGRRPEAKTGSDGTFDIEGLPAGDFLLGVHLTSAPQASDRILPTYWPAAVREPLAGVIHLLPGEHRQNLTIRLRPKVRTRLITAKVVWADGRSAPLGSWVTAETDGGIAESQPTDRHGTVRMVLLEHVAYKFWSRAFTRFRTVNGTRIGHEWVDAEGRVAAGTGPAHITLILNKPKPKR